MQATEESVQLVERVAAIDIGKAALVVCARVPGEPGTGRRRQEVAEYAVVQDLPWDASNSRCLKWPRPS